MGFSLWLFMPWPCPKSWPRRRCSLREGGGGSISRAVAHFSDPNVEVHLRRTLCDVRWNVLLAPIIHRLFPASAQNRFRAVVAVRIAPVEGPLVVQLPYILSQRQRSPSAHFVRRSGGTPCWIPFSSAVLGFALRNRSRVVRDLCFSVVEGPLNAQ